MTRPDAGWYAARWEGMAIRAEALGAVQVLAVTVLRGEARYQVVAAACGVPWWWIGCIHAREAGCSFAGHLHNGDPLAARTVHVPRGRPVAGQPPFVWTDSALDALRMRGLGPGDWSVPAALRQAEAYNGWGYADRGVASPYVWALTTVQQPGKYVADGVWDATYADTQPGVAALMRVLAGLGVHLD